MYLCKIKQFNLCFYKLCSLIPMNIDKLIVNCVVDSHMVETTHTTAFLFEMLTVWLIVIWLRPGFVLVHARKKLTVWLTYFEPMRRSFDRSRKQLAMGLTVWLIVIWLRPGFVLVHARKKLTVWLTYFEPMRRSFDRSRKQLAMGFIGTHLSC